MKVKTTRPRVESSNDINKKHREIRHGAERDSIEQRNCGLLVWSLGWAKGADMESPLCTSCGSCTDGWNAIVVSGGPREK